MLLRHIQSNIAINGTAAHSEIVQQYSITSHAYIYVTYGCQGICLHKTQGSVEGKAW